MNQVYSAWSSLVVTHPSTNHAKEGTTAAFLLPVFVSGTLYVGKSYEHFKQRKKT